MELRSRWDFPADPDASTRPDTFGTQAWWLISEQTVGSRSIVANINEMPTRTAHQLHRHSSSEQALFVISGRGLHLSDDGPPVLVQAGDAVHIPVGEWHGFANPFPETVMFATVYGGIGRREDAGYELHPGPPFDFNSYYEGSHTSGSEAGR